MSLSSVKTLRDKAFEFKKTMESNNFTFWRDEKYNLHLVLPENNVIRFPLINLRPYQQELQEVLFSGISKRIMVEWPRRAGKEVVTWNLIINAAIVDPGMYIISYPTNVRARKILWEGAALIEGKSVKFLDMIPFFLIARKDHQAMTIELINGSIIWLVGCDIDPQKLRGTNPRGMVFSELAFSDPRVMYTMLPIFRQNGGWLVGQSTYDGMNHFYWLIQNNKNDPAWFCREESIRTLLDENGKPYITDEDVEEDRRAGMPEYLIQQEYYGNVQINEETKYFAIAMNQIRESNRIIPKLYLPNKSVYAFYDIGVNDCTAITLAQFESRAGKLWPKVIGYIENNNRDLNFYLSEINAFCNRYNLSVRSHFVPHDGKNRNWGDGLKTAVDYFSDKGALAIAVKRPSAHRVAIESVRQKLYMTEFNEENTQRLIDCLSNYEKEFDDKMGRFKDTPVHDWSSHGVKSFQTLVLALEADLIAEICYDVVYIQ
jgi:phage terminase large subunit